MDKTFHQSWTWQNRHRFINNNRTTADSLLLFYLIKFLQPLTVLEIGVNEGWTMSLFLSASSQSKIEGVDINFNQFRIDHSSDRIILRKENSRELSLKSQFDFINVDGDHSYKFACIDINTAVKNLAPNGIVMVDDIGHPGVLQAAQEVIEKNLLKPVFQTVQSLYLVRPEDNVYIVPYLDELFEKTSDFIRWQRCDFGGHSIDTVDLDPVWIKHPNLFDQLLKSYNL